MCINIYWKNMFEPLIYIHIIEIPIIYTHNIAQTFEDMCFSYALFWTICLIIKKLTTRLHEKGMQNIRKYVDLC